MSRRKRRARWGEEYHVIWGMVGTIVLIVGLIGLFAVVFPPGSFSSAGLVP